MLRLQGFMDGMVCEMGKGTGSIHEGLYFEILWF